MLLAVYGLVAAGIIFTLLFALNNLLKTIFRRPQIGFIDLLLTFMTTLVLLASLIVAQTQASPDGRITQAALFVGAGLAAFSLLIILLELIRSSASPRLKGSRGILGFYSGLLLIVAAFTVPFVSAYFSVQTQAPAVVAAANAVLGTPTQIAQAQTAASTDEPAATPELDPTQQVVQTQQVRAKAIYQAISQIVMNEVHLDAATINSALEAGTPLAVIVENNGGSVEHVINAITLIMQDNVRQALAAGEINPIQAALAISQMENFIRIAVNSDFNQLGARFGEPTPDPNSTRASVFTLPTDETTVSSATLQTSPESSPLAASSTVQSSPVTATVSATRTPRPTRTPTATLFHFSTRTPTPTPTLVTPCVASVQYNLRLRSAPNRDADTLLTIPYGTTIELYGKGSASENGAIWWYAGYQGQSGWVDGQYMIVSAACDTLPLKDAP